MFYFLLFSGSVIGCNRSLTFFFPTLSPAGEPFVDGLYRGDQSATPPKLEARSGQLLSQETLPSLFGGPCFTPPCLQPTICFGSMVPTHRLLRPTTQQVPTPIGRRIAPPGRSSDTTDPPRSRCGPSVPASSPRRSKRKTPSTRRRPKRRGRGWEEHKARGAQNGLRWFLKDRPIMMSCWRVLVFLFWCVIIPRPPVVPPQVRYDWTLQTHPKHLLRRYLEGLGMPRVCAFTYLICFLCFSNETTLFTSTCVKSSGLVETRLDAAFTLGLDARWQYNWKSVRPTTSFGCCVYMRFRCKMSISLEDRLWNISSTPFDHCLDDLDASFPCRLEGR